jgi:hypothetical protein
MVAETDPAIQWNLCAIRTKLKLSFLYHVIMIYKAVAFLKKHPFTRSRKALSKKWSVYCRMRHYYINKLHGMYSPYIWTWRLNCAWGVWQVTERKWLQSHCRRKKRLCLVSKALLQRVQTLQTLSLLQDSTKSIVHSDDNGQVQEPALYKPSCHSGLKVASEVNQREWQDMEGQWLQLY